MKGLELLGKRPSIGSLSVTDEFSSDKMHSDEYSCFESFTSRNNPIRPIFKLPKGGRKLVECLPIIIKKIGKFGIAEFYISPATCQKFDIND